MHPLKVSQTDFYRCYTTILDSNKESHNIFWFLKAKMKDCALSSFKFYYEKGAVSSLNKNEIVALKPLSKNKGFDYTKVR